jgi:MHS family proline/betaine transporter-like MFS transporter
MEDWGWRIPFLIGGPPGLIAIWFRPKIKESPAFQSIMGANKRAATKSSRNDKSARQKGPISTVREHWRPIIVAKIIVAASNSLGYALTTTMPTYLTATKEYDELYGTLLTIPILSIMVR